jgi:hypothetical protein
MAIGDAIGVFVGTGATTRQPSSGVEEQISGAGRNGTTDQMDLYNGTHNEPLYGANAEPGDVDGCTAGFNNAVMINNTTYIRKQGSTDILYLSIVQTNA